ncbi:UNVERIFIED_CONTAM: hypothetical protein FKN15_027581 [Acipenser sinensis]
MPYGDKVDPLLLVPARYRPVFPSQYGTKQAILTVLLLSLASEIATVHSSVLCLLLHMPGFYPCASSFRDQHSQLRLQPDRLPVQRQEHQAKPQDTSSSAPKLRQLIIDLLESHVEAWPPACPPLEPASAAELSDFFKTSSEQYLALVFEEASSYVGREVTMDLLQYEKITVRRVLRSEEALVSKLGVTHFPSCYLHFPNGTFSRLSVHVEARSFYVYSLQMLPGVERGGYKPIMSLASERNTTADEWRQFDRSRVYMADLESSLYYSLRVEVGTHSTISGEPLSALKAYITVLVKYFPGRPVVMKLLHSLESWLKSRDDPELQYTALETVLDNEVQTPDAALPDAWRWVSCQGSQPQFRGYPCSLWTLFHLLTVQAAHSTHTPVPDPLEVLQAMHGYIQHFFSCRECAAHFKSMAAETMSRVDSLPRSVLWLWSRHNIVNIRLAENMNEREEAIRLIWFRVADRSQNWLTSYINLTYTAPLKILVAKAEPAGMLPLLVVVGATHSPPMVVEVEPAGTLPLLAEVGATHSPPRAVEGVLAGILLLLVEVGAICHPPMEMEVAPAGIRPLLAEQPRESTGDSSSPENPQETPAAPRIHRRLQQPRESTGDSSSPENPQETPAAPRIHRRLQQPRESTGDSSSPENPQETPAAPRIHRRLQQPRESTGDSSSPENPQETPAAPRIHRRLQQPRESTGDSSSPENPQETPAAPRIHRRLQQPRESTGDSSSPENPQETPAAPRIHRRLQQALQNLSVIAA